MKTNFVTTNIRLPREMLRALKLKAAQEDKSLAQLIREAIERTFGKEKQNVNKGKFKKDPFFKIIGMYEDGIKDGSIHHDRDIYGRK